MIIVYSLIYKISKNKRKKLGGINGESGSIKYIFSNSGTTRKCMYSEWVEIILILYILIQ